MPNDLYLSCQDSQLLLITGPNMSGKSTFIRQAALITLMAQIGSFVPADAATVGLSDRIFTRVGGRTTCQPVNRPSWWRWWRRRQSSTRPLVAPL